MKVLFLDIDGVLNAHEFDPEVMCGPIHRSKVETLNHVLRQTGARVVLSSAWRYLVYRGEMNVRGLDWLLRSHGLIQGRVFDITQPDTMVRGTYEGKPGTWPQTNERGSQIAKWLADWREGLGEGDPTAVSRYAVVDDLDLGIHEAGHPFVQTDGQIGITSHDADRLIHLLGRVEAT